MQKWHCRTLLDKINTKVYRYLGMIQNSKYLLLNVAIPEIMFGLVSTSIYYTVILTFQVVLGDSVFQDRQYRCWWTPAWTPCHHSPCPSPWRWSSPSPPGLNALCVRWSGSSSGILTWPTWPSLTTRCIRSHPYHTYWNKKSKVRILPLLALWVK